MTKRKSELDAVDSSNLTDQEKVKAKELINLQYDEANTLLKKSTEQDKLNNKKDRELKTQTLINEKLTESYKKHSAITSAVMSLVENVG